jgi:hypothetical protein
MEIVETPELETPLVHLNVLYSDYSNPSVSSPVSPSDQPAWSKYCEAVGDHVKKERSEGSQIIMAMSEKVTEVKSVELTEDKPEEVTEYNTEEVTKDNSEATEDKSEEFIESDSSTRDC